VLPADGTWYVVAWSPAPVSADDRLWLAIGIHDFPEGITVPVPICYATGSRRMAFFRSFLSGVSGPARRPDRLAGPAAVHERPRLRHRLRAGDGHGGDGGQPAAVRLSPYGGGVVGSAGFTGSGAGVRKFHAPLRQQQVRPGTPRVDAGAGGSIHE
jgi:hypothetical protein